MGGGREVGGGRAGVGGVWGGEVGGGFGAGAGGSIRYSVKVLLKRPCLLQAHIKNHFKPHEAQLNSAEHSTGGADRGPISAPVAFLGVTAVGLEFRCTVLVLRHRNLFSKCIVCFGV